MSNSIDFEFTFHNVGHGLFYSGSIGNFQFLYDCGARGIAHLRTVVQDYERTLSRRQIHMAVISHLHEDHINGLNELLARGVQVDTVVMPYFAPSERLLLISRRSQMPRWYPEVLVDPYSYLLTHGVRRIVFVGGSESSERDDLPPSDPASFDPEKSSINMAGLPEDIELKNEILSFDPQLGEEFATGRLTAKLHAGYGVLHGLWLFRFFNYTLDVDLSDFNRCVERITGSTAPLHLSSIINDSAMLKRLHNCYVSLEGQLKNDFNNTSLTLFHAPMEHNSLCMENVKVLSNDDIRDNSIGHDYDCMICILQRGTCHVNSNKLGQLLTGDINLNFRYDEFQTHYRAHRHRTNITQLPHHGSRYNWNEAILQDFRNCHHYIASARRDRGTHPHAVVISDVYRDRRCFHWVNEHCSFSITGRLAW